MQIVKRMKNIPENSLIENGFGKVDYWDTFKIDKNTNDTIDKITITIFKIPGWVKVLLKIRNSVVKIFGLKTDDAEPAIVSDNFVIGSNPGFFNVIDRNENEIVMGENDKHLNFRLSVLIDKKETMPAIYLTTIVKYNNIWGWIYFLPVKPFHKLIVKALLKNL